MEKVNTDELVDVLRAEMNTLMPESRVLCVSDVDEETYKIHIYNNATDSITGICIPISDMLFSVLAKTSMKRLAHIAFDVFQKAYNMEIE